ncbi:MAG: protein translocase subunit SecD [Rhodospirillales bacterium]|nr:protein translocase subunit SecD [Rhodospirillales bacterium]
MVHFTKWKIALVVLVCVAGLWCAWPNLLSRDTAAALPEWLPVPEQINLGLDLRGGSHLLLEVETGVVIQELMEALVDTARAELRQARIRYTGLGADGASVRVTIMEPGRLDEAVKLLRDADADTAVSVDGDRITLTMTDAAIADRQRSAVAKTVEIVRRRIDETGVREPTIVPQGDDRVLVQLPGIDDPEQMKRLLGKTAKMAFHLADDQTPVAEALAGRVPPGSMLLPLDSQREGRGQQQRIVVQKRVVVSGEHLIDAQPTFDQQNNMPIVSFRFDTVGAKRFGDATSKNVGRRLAIVLDGRVISAPVIRDAILGGSGIITGDFTVEESNELSLLLRAGALPAPLRILEERSVGPELGADSITAGEVAGVVGLVVVAIFMVVAYGFFGVLADLALLFNIVLIVAALSVLQATLTLPGIAGIVLTIGMAVDANVLVFERIREEVRAGRTPISAIDTGYSRATTTIIDSNLTTLIAVTVLYVFGSGPIQGFAVTLALGILTSLFTAIMLTRMWVVLWLRRTRPKVIPI